MIESRNFEPPVEKDFVVSFMALLIPHLEGTRSDNPLDKGGLTKWGVSSRYNPEVSDKSYDMNAALKSYAKYVRELGMVDFYQYHRSVATMMAMFQFGFNTNVRHMTKVLQAALNVEGSNHLADYVLLNIDGIRGPKTNAAVRQVIGAVGDEHFSETLLHLQAGWYVAHGQWSHQPHFVKGWVNRVSGNYRKALAEREDSRATILAQLDDPDRTYA